MTNNKILRELARIEKQLQPINYLKGSPVAIWLSKLIKSTTLDLIY